MEVQATSMLKYVGIFILSGASVVAVSHLAISGRTTLAGLLVFAPIVSLWSYLYLAIFSDKDILQGTVYGTILATPSVVIFVLSLHFLLKSFPALLAIGIALFFWLISAGIAIKFGTQV